MRGTPMGSSVLDSSQPVKGDANDGNRRTLELGTTTASTADARSDAMTASTLPVQQLLFNANGAFGGTAESDTAKAAPTAEEQAAAGENAQQGDAATRDKPLTINDIGEVPIFFILDNRPNTGDKLAPPVGLHDPDKTTPLQITDDKGRVITTDSGDKNVNWSINQNAETGDIETINYPDGKTRQLKHKDGELSRIETTEKNAEGQPSKTVFSRDPDTKKWYAEIGGLKAELPGDIQFSKDGTLSFQIDNQGKWRAERPDGTVAIERTISSGARVAFNDDNTVQLLTRPDKSKVDCVREKGELTTINEIGADGKTTSWAKNGEKWVSNTTPPQERTAFEVNDNGNVSFVGADNVKHTITGGGVELNQNPNGSEFKFDKEGRFTDLKDANGLKVKGIVYDQESGKVLRSQIGAEGGQTCTYEREGLGNSWIYTVNDASGNPIKSDRWFGDITVGKDGTYAYNEDPRHGRNKEGMWAVYKLDGTQFLLKDDGQGSRAIFDMNKQLLQLERQNGTRLEVARTNGFATQIIDTQLNGEQIKYTFDPASASYRSDNPNARPLKKVESTGDGITQITDIAGTVQSINIDGSSLVKNADGSASEVDSLGQVRKTISKDGSVSRSFNWENGKLVSVNESRKGGETRTIAGKDMTAGSDGIIRYTDVDGQKLSTTADGSWQQWQTINGRDFLAKTVSPKGYMRTFVRDESGEPISMLDSKPTKDGQVQTEEYRRVMENGKYSDSWGKVGKDGKVTARHNVNILDNGTYSYLDSNGKDKIAKVGDRGLEGGFSDGVDEARERLTELMESHLDEAQKKRFQTILDRFEKRGKERIEAQTAGGLDPEKSSEEWDIKISKTYDHLSQMLDPNAPNAQYDLKTRAKLVENAAFAMAAPVKANDQGNWGCCWMISGVYCGVIQYPDKMASMLSQLATTGKYTDNNGKSWDPPKHLLSLTNQGSSWTIENCGNTRRSPVSEIWTSVAAYMSNDGRRMDRGAGGGHGQAMNHAMKQITGDTWKVTGERNMMGTSLKQELLTKGGFVCLMPGHMYLGALEKHGSEWKLVASMQHGDGGRRVNGTVTDLASWNVQRTQMRYNPDIDLPECKDQPIGPGQGPPGGWDGGGGRGGGGRWRPGFFIRRLFRGGCEGGCCSDCSSGDWRSAQDEAYRNRRSREAMDRESASRLEQMASDILDDDRRFNLRRRPSRAA
ncbi:MAG: hypothetical protein SGJ27_26975 [Candidatus Melainabacteria bacterium]|nr:hypothetical protein [Candidatus Melainabacteria bacterium]